MQHNEKKEGENRAASGAKPSEPLVRRLTGDELNKLRQEMVEASTWARAELLRRRRARGDLT